MAMKRNWKRDNLRIRFPSAISIEETGLDSPSYGEHSVLFSGRKPRGSWSKVPVLQTLIRSMAERGGRQVDSEEKFDAVSSNIPNDMNEHTNHTVNDLQERKKAVQEGKIFEFVHHLKEKRKSRKFQGSIAENQQLLHKGEDPRIGEMIPKSSAEVVHEEAGPKKKEPFCHNLTCDEKCLCLDRVGAMEHHTFKESHGQVNVSSMLAPMKLETLIILDTSEGAVSIPAHVSKANEGETDTTLQPLDRVDESADLIHMESSLRVTAPPPDLFLPKEIATNINMLPGSTLNAKSTGVAPLVDMDIHINKKLSSEECEMEIPNSAMDEMLRSRTTHNSIRARNRWRSLKHTVSFAKHLAARSHYASTYVEEERQFEELLDPQFTSKEDVGGVGAATFEGTKTGPRSRVKGRKGMEALLVRQEKSIINFLQDFYVACLKMHTGNFLVGVFIAPVLLGLFFTPLYMLDLGGLTFDEGAVDSKFICPWLSKMERCSQYLNIFLYALSLSTTFGGSPVVAHSAYCILVANFNTLMAQFLFVFFSGAVFARMSHPSHPIRCSKKAIVRNEDYVPTFPVDLEENFRVFAVRLVLTGPLPCELVDTKICLTFRIFVNLPSGEMFCATQDLELVRPEVSYLRYGIMVRHIISRKSPLYGHTMESLVEGDASFSLTIMGVERTSMQPVFHIQDYFVCDGDVEWDADYVDFVETNEKGQRVLNHSKIDSLRSFKVAGVVAQAISRMEAGAARHRRERANKAD